MDEMSSKENSDDLTNNEQDANLNPLEQLDIARKQILEGVRNRFLDRLEELEEKNDLFQKLTKQFSEYGLSNEEMVVLKLAFLYEFKPEELDLLVTHDAHNKPFSEIGGQFATRIPGLIPTVQTAIFLIKTNSDTQSAYSFIDLFGPDQTLSKNNFIELKSNHEQALPILAQSIIPTAEAIAILRGSEYEPVFSSSFPAQRITTGMEWDDLVLEHKSKTELADIKDWIEFAHKTPEHWKVDRNVKKGYRALFYGPSGTGKTLCATLLGKYTGKEVYKINLGMVVSKYVGETEKNLSRIFDQAEDRNWILFFDEAESMFGKRTEVRSSNDRFANQETGFLLQRIENYDGVIILASNLKGNMDPAFSRRFQSTIHFPAPSENDRLILWQNNLEPLPLDDSVDLNEIASNYSITGGNIINVLRYCAIQASMREEALVYQQDILYGLKREFEKEGRIMR